MAERQTRIRTKTVDGIWEILAMVSHPMETGRRTDPLTKEKIPAHFIQKMTFAVNGKPVAVADLSQAVSKDPLLSVRVKNAKAGDKVTVSWSDNQGEKGEQEAVLGG